MDYNIYPEKLLSGLVAAVASVFIKNLLPLFICVIVFEIVDFVTGVIKSYVLAKRAGKHFAFESVKAWRTIYKLVFILLGIMLAEMLDATVCETRLRLANYFTAFCCGVELWSFLENAAAISEHPVFRWLRKFMQTKVEHELDTDFDKLIGEDSKGNGAVADGGSYTAGKSVASEVDSSELGNSEIDSSELDSSKVDRSNVGR